MKHDFSQETFCIADPANLSGFRPNFPLQPGTDEEIFRVK